MILRLHVWGVRDYMDCEHGFITKEFRDIIWLDAFHNDDDCIITTHFYDKASHLEKWCKKHKFDYFHEVQDINVEVKFK